MSSPVSTDGDVESYVEMFLKPVATGVYDWIPITAPLRDGDLLVSDGNSDLNDTPGVPNRCHFSVHDPDGDLNRKNPMGLYFGSIGLGTPTRSGAWSVDDQCGRTETNTWGSVGNVAGDAWTNGSSSGGTVAATDWTVSSGSARHSIPAAGAYRWSELSKTTRLYTDCEVRIRVTFPVTNVTGSGAMAAEVWMRTVDVNTNIVVSVAANLDETISVALADKTAGTSRYLLNYTAIAGLNLGTTGTAYDIRCQVEKATVRAKVWAVGSPEPVGWQVSGYQATIRAGYVGVASFAYTGNTNTKPLSFQYDQVQVRIPAFSGEVADLKTTGDDKTEPKVTEVDAAGLMDRLQNQAAPAESAMKRSRSRARRWLYVGSLSASLAGADARTYTATTASLGNVTIGDFLYLVDSNGFRKEDTQFTIVGGSVAGANTILQFTPDAREPVALNDTAVVYRGLTQALQPIAYWPCEDEENATQVSSGLVGGIPLSISGPNPEFASESGFLCSKPILKVNDAELRAVIPEYTTSATAVTLSFLLSMPSTDETPATGTDLVQFYTSGTGFSYDLRYTANGNGSFQLLVFSTGLATLFDSGQIDFGLRGNKQIVTLVLEQVGGTVTYRLFTIKVDGTTGGTGPSTVTSVTTLGKITDIRVNPGGGYNDVGYGHMTVVPGIWGVNEVAFEFDAWGNRPAIQRYQRLAFEDAVPITFRDDWDVLTTNVGIQKVDKVAGLLQDPARSDLGFLHGTRGATALEYITRGALTNQAARATFVAADCKDLELLADYTKVANRVSVTRDGGTTATVEKSTGTLSTLDAPNGVGLRETSFRLSLGGDNQVATHAYARLGLGTIDQYRVPKITITSAGTSTVSLETLLSLGVGDRIDIAGLTALDIYDTLTQLVVGVRIRLGDRNYPRVELTCVPYEPFSTLALTADRYARVDTADTSTGSTLTTTATGSLTLTSASGAYSCSADAADYPVDVMITGERITLSAVADTATPGVQTATVSARSVNGVVKTHAVGEEVVLFEPNYWQFR